MKSNDYYQPYPSDFDDSPSDESDQYRAMREALEAIRCFTPGVVSRLKVVLDDTETPPTVKVKICEIFLNRAFNKPDASVRLTSPAETVARSRAYIMALTDQIRQEMDDP